jgi:hypothetical protein
MSFLFNFFSFSFFAHNIIQQFGSLITILYRSLHYLIFKVQKIEILVIITA